MKIKLILSMLFLLCSISVNAESIEWKTDNDTLIISGSGEMTDYSAQNKAPWSDTEFKKLVVNEGITSIGDWCFADCTDLEQLTLPSTLKSIGERAFYNCIELDEIIIPDNVSEIKSGAFNSCIQAKKVSLPDKLTYIGDSSFMNLPALSAVVIPENVNYIGSWAFFGNTSMTGLYFKGNVPEYIGNYLIAGINEDYTIYFSQKHVDNWIEKDYFNPEKTSIFTSLISVYVNNSMVNFDSQPAIMADRTLVPIRAIFEKMGAVVEWNDALKTVRATREDTVIEIPINSKVIKVNGVEKQTDVPAVILQSRTLVPVRVISESFGAEVTWNEKEKAVYINF